MSLPLSNSSADTFASSSGVAYASEAASSSENALALSSAADNILTYFSKIIQSKLPVAEQDIDPARSPELEKIVLETKELPHDTFQALFDILRVVDSHREQLAVFRSKAENDEPLSPCTFKAQSQSLMKSGNEIIKKHRKIISENDKSVKTSYKELSSRIRKGFDEKENTEHWQKRLDAVKDDIVPEMSNLLAPVQSAAKVAAGLTTCEISQKLDQKLKDLGMSDSASRGDMRVVISTQSKLKDYLQDSQNAGVYWVIISQEIYVKLLEEGSSSKASIMLRIDFVDHMMSQVISPIEKYLARWKETYGTGITIIREVDEFCDVVPKIIEDIERIFGAKEIIKSSHQAKFGELVYDLGLTIFKYLGLMKDNFNRKTIDPEKQRKFLQVTTIQFTKTTVRLTCALCSILETQASTRKSRKAEKDRLADDRCFEDGLWKNKTLVKPSEVQLILEKVERAVDAIARLANASGTGKIVESIRGNKIERADFKLDISIGSLRRLDHILEEDVDAGLERLGKLLIEQEPKAHAGQIRSLLRKFNRHKC